MKSLSTGCTVGFIRLLHTWSDLDETEASKFEILISVNVEANIVLHHLTGIRKKYHKFKYYEFRMAKNDSIKKAIDKHMENFCFDKEHIIRNVLEWPVQKMVLDYLIVDNNLILDPYNVKSNINTIIERWTKKHVVPSVLSDCWSTQYASLAHVNTSVFLGVMCSFSLDELLLVVRDLLNSKVAGLSGIFNELWKHSNKKILSSLLDICNLCLEPIALIETACKVLSKLLSDRISLACSSCATNVFCVGKDITAADILGLSVYMKVVDLLRRFGIIYVDQLLNHQSSSVRDLGSSDACGGAAAYFPSADISVGIRVLSLLSSMLAKMQAIVLVLDCVSIHSLKTDFFLATLVT
ncbi:hypothetical protein G9A89_002790 [Geosiphon pyriformis]|nr:hypothetical protein G9A89_002790 [Geosiphon pyriformis]